MGNDLLYHTSMETITAFVLFLSLLTIFGIDASLKRREFLQKLWRESLVPEVVKTPERLSKRA
ncbi:MAG: hypothetical protein DPW18_03880 [Chloroflexi bacterium]|nr:hypothetical protein [Chloroflexota bacterium]